MKVWEVVLYDCESSSTKYVCATKEIAERQLFRLRDELVNRWKEDNRNAVDFIMKTYVGQIEFIKSGVKDANAMYSSMIKNLSSDDYTRWENYPHECLCIRETEVITK